MLTVSESDGIGAWSLRDGEGDGSCGGAREPGQDFNWRAAGIAVQWELRSVVALHRMPGSNRLRMGQKSGHEATFDNAG